MTNWRRGAARCGAVQCGAARCDAARPEWQASLWCTPTSKARGRSLSSSGQAITNSLKWRNGGEEQTREESIRRQTTKKRQTLPERRAHRARGGRRHRRLQRRRDETAAGSKQGPVNGCEYLAGEEPQDRPDAGRGRGKAGDIKENEASRQDEVRETGRLSSGRSGATGDGMMSR